MMINKEDMVDMLITTFEELKQECKTVVQAALHHRNISTEWTHGNIDEWKFIEEDDCIGMVLAIKYEDNTWFRYYGTHNSIAHMLILQGLEDNNV